MSEQNLTKALYKDSFLIFVNRLLISLARIAATILFSYYLTTSLYGTYQNVWVQFSTLFAISGLSLSSFVFSYSPQKVVQIISQLKTKNYLLGAALVFLSAVLFGLFQQEAGIAFFAGFIFLVISTASIVLDSILISFQKLKPLLVINVAYVLLFIGIHFFWLEAGSFSLTQLFLFLSGLGLFKTIFCFKIFRTEQSKHLLSTALEPLLDNKFKLLWRHLFLFDVIQILMSFSDKFVVSLLLPASESAVYQNATYTVPLIAVVFSAVSNAILIQLSVKNQSKAAEANILLKSAKLFSAIALPLFFFLLFFSQEFIVFVFSDKYLASVSIFKVSIWMIPLSMFNGVILLQKYEKGGIINKGMVLDILVTIALIYPMYQLFGLPGIPLSFILATFTQSIYYAWQYVNLLKMSALHFLPVRDWLIKSLIFGSMSFAFHYSFISILDWNSRTAFLISATLVGIVAVFILIRDAKKGGELDVRN